MSSGKRVVVTGAGRGIGREIARAFAVAGATVAISARTTSDLNAVADAIIADGGICFPITCDVTDPEQVEYLRAAAWERMGGVDILVNNAGAAGSHKFVDHPDELWHAMLQANLTSVFYTSRAFVAPMVAQRWGRIINIASITAKAGARYVAAYTAAKHGVVGLTRALAAEFATTGVTVNAICPGYVDTPMTDRTITNIVERTGMLPEAARESLEQLSPQRRLIAPEEVAALAVYLAQESSRGITGQAINVDGGAVMY